MTYEELEHYFNNIDIPESIKIDGAVTQSNLPYQVKQYLALMKAQPTVALWENKLRLIKERLENPYRE